jgi:hypothetical protein
MKEQLTYYFSYTFSLTYHTLNWTWAFTIFYSAKLTTMSRKCACGKWLVIGKSTCGSCSTPHNKTHSPPGKTTSDNKTPKVCRHGKNCHRDHCYFVHPEGKESSKRKKNSGHMSERDRLKAERRQAFEFQPPQNYEKEFSGHDFGKNTIWEPPDNLQKTTINLSLDESYELYFPLELTNKDYLRYFLYNSIVLFIPYI